MRQSWVVAVVCGWAIVQAAQCNGWPFGQSVAAEGSEMAWLGSGHDANVIYERLAHLIHAPRGVKDQFAQELKIIIDSALGSDVRGTAIIAYSRLGNYDDLYEILNRGKSSQLISPDDYYGELVSMLPTGSAARDDELMGELIAASNAVGNHLLMSALAENPALFMTLSAEQKKRLHEYVLHHKPPLGPDFSSFGLLDVFSYEKWLKAQFNTSSETGAQKSLVDYVLSLYANGLQDPRDAVMLGHTEFIDALREQDPAFFGRLMNTVKQYFESYPANNLAEDLVRNN